jgi:F-type H+-transporting ATPase subunit a
MDLHVEVAPEILWRISIPGTSQEFLVTNSFITMLLVMGSLLIVGTIIARRATLVPSHIQSVFEVIVEFILGIVESAAGARAARRLLPLIGGIFIFILFANYSGLLPGVGTIWLDPRNVGEHIYLLRPPSADLNMTIAMALVTFVTVQIAGISAHGVVGRIKHMADPPFLFPIELISEFSRIISLSFRLFGNVFAGEVLLGVMYTIANIIKFSVIGLLIPVVFLYLEVLFGFIQALVFALLTLVYIVLATAHTGDVEDHTQEETVEKVEELPDLGGTPASSSGD